MKKIITTILILAAVLTINSQTVQRKEKNKTIVVTKTSNDKTTIADKNKTQIVTKTNTETKTVIDQSNPIIISKTTTEKTTFADKTKSISDSTSVNITSITPAEIIKDTLVVPKGKFKIFKTKAHASYYAAKFSGRRSASGKIFYNDKYMAAHKTLPFGTKLKVTNEANKKTVYVDVVDRGPFIKGRELDLSSRAFKEIASSKGAGAVIVTIEILQK